MYKSVFAAAVCCEIAIIASKAISVRARFKYGVKNVTITVVQSDLSPIVNHTHLVVLLHILIVLGRAVLLSPRRRRFLRHEPNVERSR